MEKTATLNLRVNPEVKRDAENVLSQLGISMSTAVTMFLHQVTLSGGLPFTPQLPHAPHALDLDVMSDKELADLLANRLSKAELNKTMPLSEAKTRLLS